MTGNSGALGGAKLTIESRWGWADFRNRHPYRAEYERWDKIAQRNYENGRLRAANVLAAFGSIPSQQTRRVYRLAADRIGAVDPSGKGRW